MLQVERLDGEQARSAGQVMAGGHGSVFQPVARAGLATAAIYRALKSVSSAVLWGAGGFVTGAIFWHFIGFWGFVSDVVFSRRAQLEHRLIAQSGPQCIEVALARATGAIRAVPCAFEAPELDESANSVKGDFLGYRHRLARTPRNESAIKLSSGEK